MKVHSKVLGVTWIIISSIVLLIGISYLYQYSEPGIFWIYMVPAWITLNKVFAGIVGLYIGVNLLVRITSEVVLPFSVILLMYIIYDLIKLGSEMIYDSGSNLILIFLSILTIRNGSNLDTKRLAMLKRKEYLILMLFAISPYFLDSWTLYGLFSFLH